MVPDIQNEKEIDSLDQIMSLWDFMMTYHELFKLPTFRPLELYYSLKNDKNTTYLCK